MESSVRDILVAKLDALLADCDLVMDSANYEKPFTTSMTSSSSPESNL